MLKPLLKRIAGSLPLSAYRLLSGPGVLGLYYHVVSDEPLPHIRHLYACKGEKAFESDLLYLAANFDLLTYEQLVEHRLRGKRSEAGSAILTFDDGLSECYSVVRPLLLKHRIPCVFFIPTDYVDNRQMCSDHKASLCIDRVMALEDKTRLDVVASVNDAYGKDFDNEAELKQWTRSVAASEHSAIDWLCRLLDIDVQHYLDVQRPYMSTEEIARLAQDGFTIGAHSVSHRQFGSLTDSEIEQEIVDSCQAVTALSGLPYAPFAFPFSADGVSRRLLQDIRGKHGYVGLLFDTNGTLPDRSFMVNRTCGDWPDDLAHESSNLPRLLARAYLEGLTTRRHRR